MSRFLPSTLAALTLALALTACGGSDGSDGGSDGGSDAGATSDGARPGDGLPTLEGDSCDVDVTLTGAVEQSWSGDGSVAVSDSDSAPPASYQTLDGDAVLSLLSEGNGFDATVLLTVGAASYGVETGSAGVEIDPDGGGATIDATGTAIGGDESVDIAATFTC